MKTMTLEEAWTYCLEQWAWIVEQIKTGCREDVWSLKNRKEPKK